MSIAAASPPAPSAPPPGAAAAAVWTDERETGELLGVTRAALSKWRREKGLPSPACWREQERRLVYDVAACRAWRAATLKPRPRGAESGGGAAEPPTAAAVVPGVAGHVAAKVASERIRAQLLQIELDRRMAELLDAGEVAEAWERGIGLMRDQVLAVPGRVVERLPLSIGLGPEVAAALIDKLAGELAQVFTDHAGSPLVELRGPRADPKLWPVRKHSM